jgi:hypothetical protein
MKLATNKLGTMHYQVYEYLKSHCIGEKNAIAMHDLAETMFTSDREIRKVIDELIRFKHGKTIIASSQNGYYIPFDEQEAMKSRGMLKSRLKSALERYKALYPDDTHWVYTYLSELDQKYESVSQGQVVIAFNKGNKETINYYGKEYAQAKGYDNLFEFAHLEEK